MQNFGQWQDYEAGQDVSTIKKLGRWLRDYFIPSGNAVRRLRTELDLMALCLNAAPDGYLMWDDGNRFIVPRKAKTILNIVNCNNKQQLLDAFSEGDRKALDKLIDEMEKQQMPFSIVCETDSKHHLVNVEGVLRKIGENAAIRVLWLRDVTHVTHDVERMELLKSRAEDSLVLYQKGMENINFPVWFRDSDFKIIECNATYAKTLDLTPDEVVEGQVEILGSKGMLVRKMAENAKTMRQPQYDKQHIVVDGERKLYP